MIHELLRAEDLQLKRGSSNQLHHMDFSVAEGESVGLIGLSGGGKTALAKILCGELDADGGRVLHQGVPVQRESLIKMGIRISGENRLLENLSVQEYLLVLKYPSETRGFLIPWKKIRKKCKAMLEEYFLEEYLDVPVSNIPISIQHLLMLVGAIAREKRLIILDHIADTYSPSEEIRLAACIRQVCQKGLSVLYLSSHLDSVLWELDRITVVRNGRRIKELYRGTFTEPSLRAYMYGYRSVAEETREPRPKSETMLLLDEVALPEQGLIPIHDTDGSVKNLLARLQEVSDRTITFYTAESLFDCWIDEMSALDNSLLPVAQRLSGAGFHIRKSVRQLLCTECMRQTGLSIEQMDQLVKNLSRMERFRLLLYRGITNRTSIYVLDRITAGADLQDREEMRRISKDLPGLLLYISGDYGELMAFQMQIYMLKNGHLRKERP